MGIHDFGIFMFASLLLWITPGPDTMYILARSITQGRMAGVLSALGIGAGTIVHTLLAAFGLSAILTGSAWAFMFIKSVGACYLILLGVQSLRQRVAIPDKDNLAPVNQWSVFRQGFMTNLFNPKVAMFFLAFLPQFVDTSADLGPLPFVILGSAFVVGGTTYCALLAVFAAALSESLRSNHRTIGNLRRLSGCVYIGLGLHLLRQKPQLT